MGSEMCIRDRSRRDTLFRRFCIKISENKRFSDAWLEKRDFADHNLRQQQIVTEKFARTERLYRSPLYTIRRTINDIFVT